VRNVTITTFIENRSLLQEGEWGKYTVFHEINNYSLRLGDGGDPHFAIQKVTFPTINGSMKVIFNYLDISIEFNYEPIPIYIDVETTKAEFQGALFLWIILTIIVGVFCEYPARKLQRHAVVIPGLPVLSILALATSISAMIFILTYLSFPFGFFEKIILFVLGVEPWVIEVPFFLLFTLWLGHRHSPDNLKTVQLYYSKFIPKGDNDIWKADMRDDYCAYEKNGSWYICDPDSWSQFFWRFLNFRIAMKGFHKGIKPHEGVWKRNDQRIWIAMEDLTIEGKGLHPKVNKDVRGILQTAGIVTIGGFCMVLAGTNLLIGLPQFLLLGIAFVIIGVGIFGRGSLLELEYSSLIWDFDAIEHIEAEQIMTQYVNFQNLRKRIKDLQSEVATLSANFHSQVILFVVQFVAKINTMLTHADIILELDEAPGPKEDIEDFKKRKEKDGSLKKKTQEKKK
jgi:hypothetical protein